ncbi:hypothetical protein GCM10009798_27810 [Nocardioides panacihumi]|uniref:Uncharacterized protein n=1 Tax=Nocardioides panacihumi TaxID=400774 RepID=A0ABN2R9X4_9ACTN
MLQQRSADRGDDVWRELSAQADAVDPGADPFAGLRDDDPTVLRGRGPGLGDGHGDPFGEGEGDDCPPIRPERIVNV